MSETQKIIKIIAYLLAISIIIGICTGVFNIINAFIPTTEKIVVDDYYKELQLKIIPVESAKNHLAEVTEAMDFDDKEVDSLDEALDALDDAIDIMTDSLEEEE